MWDWLLGHRDGFSSSFATSAANARMSNVEVRRSLDSMLSEIKKLRRFNAKLLSDLRLKDVLLSQARKSKEASDLAGTIFEADAREKQADIEVLVQRVKMLQVEKEALHDAKRDEGMTVEQSAVYTLGALVKAEDAAWDAIMRCHEVMRPQCPLTPLDQTPASRPFEYVPNCLAPTVVAPLPPTRKKYCVILDIDETQVHFSLESYPARKAELRFRGGIETALRRLCKLKDHIEIGLWTAGVPRYAIAARELLTMIAKQHELFDWTIARDPSWSSQGVKKDLATLGRDTQNMLLIDNARKVIVQKENSLIVTNFYSAVKGTQDNTLDIVVALVEELVANGSASVTQFLKDKAVEGSVLSQGGYYYVPTSWSPEVTQKRLNTELAQAGDIHEVDQSFAALTNALAQSR